MKRPEQDVHRKNPECASRQRRIMAAASGSLRLPSRRRSRRQGPPRPRSRSRMFRNSPGLGVRPPKPGAPPGATITETATPTSSSITTAIAPRCIGTIATAPSPRCPPRSMARRRRGGRGGRANVDTHGVSWADVDNDGDDDLYQAVDLGVDMIHTNAGPACSPTARAHMASTSCVTRPRASRSSSTTTVTGGSTWPWSHSYGRRSIRNFSAAPSAPPPQPTWPAGPTGNGPIWSTSTRPPAWNCSARRATAAIRRSTPSRTARSAT